MLHHAVLKRDYLYASIGKTEGGYYVGSTPSLSTPPPKKKNQKKSNNNSQKKKEFNA